MLGVQHESLGIWILPRSTEESSENLIGNISYNIASRHLFTHFHQIIMDKYPDLKATLLEDSCGSNALEITIKCTTIHQLDMFIVSELHCF